MPVKLLIFDLDGTLVDTRTDIANALNAAIGPVGIQPLSTERVTELIGEGLTRLVEKALGDEYASHGQDVLKRFLRHYTAHIADNSKPYPFVSDVLEELGGIKKAVLSNKRQALSTALLGKLGLDAYFDLVAGSDTTPEKKPSPAAVGHVLEALDVRAEEAAIVGDSRFDIQAGREAGVRTIAVTYGYMPMDQLSEADHLIDNMKALPSLLQVLSGNALVPREKRHRIPSIFLEYIDLKIKIADEYVPSMLMDLSGHGLRMKCPLPLAPGSVRECTISAPRSLEREIALTLSVRHCAEHEGGYVVGARIEDVNNELWFRVFRHILKFISQREGEVF